MTTEKFYQLNKNEIEFIPFDIETTGFKSADDDFMTNLILHHDGMYQIWINTDGTTISAKKLSESVAEGTEITNFDLHVCETEDELLLNVEDYLDKHTTDNAILTAFNGETWRGDTDFDVPFMRTRCLRNGIGWILDGFWYTDTYEVFSQSSRFDTTIKATPSLSSMKKADLQEFIDDMGYDIEYEKMYKSDIVSAINNNTTITSTDLENWASKKLPVESLEDIDPEDPSSLTATNLKSFIDYLNDSSKNVLIKYDALNKDELVAAIENEKFTQNMLVEWHKETGRSIGNTTATTLDDIHKVLLEDLTQDEEWRRNLPFEVEVFEPFDPFESSGEAVTEYLNENFSDVILHCLADVARTVNITRMMAEYTPKKDYKPKVL